MKSSFIKMSKFHPLLTDTLPYEVPVLFSNRGLFNTIKTAYDKYYGEMVHEKAKGNLSEEPINIEAFIKTKFITDPELTSLKDRISSLFKKDLLPYEYSIVQNKNKVRKLSLIHPISQIKICDFYAQHENEILFYSSRSNVSLRHPVKVSSRIFRQHTALLNKLTKESEQANCEDIPDILEERECLDLEDIPNTYFIYKKYRLIYEFYDSPEFLELEQRFELCMKFDVKRCFESIYTHSIAWAIKGKNYAKKHRKIGFENEIDVLMQKSNWGETHGIPIGSEFSRIFAEIILQKIDMEIEKILEDKKFTVNGRNIKNGFDFKIRRYVDDFFVFVNNKEIGDAIISEYEKKLQEYKLFINQEKNEIKYRPFVTNVTAAKQQILPELKKILYLFHGSEEQKINENNIFSNYNNVPNHAEKSIILFLRSVIHNNQIEMLDISNLILSVIKKDLIKILKLITNINLTNENRDRILKGICKYLNTVLDLSFYVFKLSARANSTYGICKICFEILEIVNQVNDYKLNAEIKQKIYSQFLLFFENKKMASQSITEFLDIIWVIEKLGENYTLTSSRLSDIFQIHQKKLSYFEIMVILSYIKNIPEYTEIKKILLNSINEKLSEKEDIFVETETFMMFFDIIKCPYIEDTYKKNILKLASFSENKQKIIDFISHQEWFFGWNELLTLKKIFEIKELQKAY